MAKQINLYLYTGHNTLPVTFTSTDTTTAKVVFTPGANDTDLKIAWACSNDTSTINLQLFLRRGGVNYLLGTVRIVTLSGTDGLNPNVNLLNTTAFPGLQLDPVGKPYLEVMAGDAIWAAPLVTMTAAKTLTVFMGGHDL